MRFIRGHVSLKRRKKKHLWGKEQGSEERFGQRDVAMKSCWDRGKQKGLTPKSSAVWGIRSQDLACWKTVSGKEGSLCCRLLAAVICTLSNPNLPAVSPELEPSTESLPKPLSWTLSRDAG